VDISSTNPLSPSPLYRDSVVARQRELPQTEGIEAAGQQALESATAREAQLQAATQQVTGSRESAAPQLNNRATELQSSLQAQLIGSQARRVQQAQQQASSVTQQSPTQPAANPAVTANNRSADKRSLTSPGDNSAPPPDTLARQSATPRSTPQPANRNEDSSRSELNAAAQQQAVVQYQITQSLLQSASADKIKATA
jgi:hypothetical protein